MHYRLHKPKGSAQTGRQRLAGLTPQGGILRTVHQMTCLLNFYETKHIRRPEQTNDYVLRTDSEGFIHTLFVHYIDS